MKNKSKVKNYLLLYTALVIFSLSSVMNKLASACVFPSTGFLFFYAAGLAILLLYAVLWQIVLKRFDLSAAYANRSAATVLGMFWGVVLFQEKVTWNMLLGVVIIAAGIAIMIAGEEM